MNTSDKLKKITDKIYQEGVEKARTEAEQIMENARQEAENIIGQARKKEAEIHEQVQKQTAEMKQNTDAELRLAARQFMSTLKQEISGNVINAQVETPVREAFGDPEFIREMMLTIVKNWNPMKPEDMHLKLLLPAEREQELKGFFNSKAKELLNSGLEISYLPTIKDGFKIEPKNSSYYINFTDEGFENYFKNYLRDKTRKMIFE